MVWKFIAYDLNGIPCINGHGVGVVKQPVLFVYDPTFTLGSESYGYIDVTSIENIFNNAFNLSGRDYTFVRDRVEELVKQRAYDDALGVVNNSTGLTPAVNDHYVISATPDGDFANYPGAIAQWDGTQWLFKSAQEVGYYQLTPTEKEIAAKLYIAELSIYAADFPDDIDEWSKEYHYKATDSREDRIRVAETIVRKQLTPYQSVIMLFITSYVIQMDIGFGNQQFCVDMHKNYWRFGNVGTLEGYDPILNPVPAFGILDYIYGRSLFTGFGLVDMPWQPKTMANIAAVAEALNKVLVTEGVVNR